MHSERPERPPDMSRATKVRLRFAKCGDLRFLSHLDLMRCLERMLRRARVPIAATQGFNPRPKMTFGLALGLGIAARREVVDLELLEPWEPPRLLERLTAVAPPGFAWVEARMLPSDATAPRPHAVEYEVPVAGARRPGVRAALDALLAATTWPQVRRRRDREQVVDLRAQIIRAELTDEGALRFRLAVRPDGSARPEDLLEALGLRDSLDEGAVLIRTDVDLETDSQPAGPPHPRAAARP
jgi:radical SAM-linked protein